MKSKSPLLASLFVALLPVSAPTSAQITSGNIMGEALVGDTIVVDGIGTGFHRELRIDDDGRYQLRRVPIGAYRVTHRYADGGEIRQYRLAVHAGVTVLVK